MGGLPLPDVVRKLLQDPSILKWHPADETYEVMHGEKFEKRSVMWHSRPRVRPCRVRSPMPVRARVARHAMGRGVFSREGLSL
jgi:hypothetical protein